MSDDDNGSEFGLVMPFLPVVSKGGPYDDQAYVAGWEMGQLTLMLEQSYPDEIDTTVHEPNGPQADLIAMRHGYHCELRPSGTDGYLFALFTATEEDDQR